MTTRMSITQRMTPTTTEATPAGPRTRLLTLVAAGTLAVTACGATSDPDGLAYADPDRSDEAEAAVEDRPDQDGSTETADEQAATTFLQALDRLGTDYRFASSLVTAGGGRIIIDGYRTDQAMTFELTVDDLTVETVARDGLLWTRPLGVDEWSSSTWTDDHDPIAPLRNPLRVRGEGETGLVAVYPGSHLGLGTDRAVEVEVTVDGEAIRFTTVAADVRLESVLTLAEELPAIVSPS